MRRCVLTLLVLAGYGVLAAQAAGSQPAFTSRPIASDQRAAKTLLSPAIPGCHTAADTCEPDHVFDVYFYNPAPVCHYEITVDWGDGQQTKFALVDTYSTSHTYVDPGVYNYLASSPPGAGPGCPPGEQRYTVEVPFSYSQLSLISRVERAAHKFRKHLKGFKKAAKHRSPSLNRKAKGIVKDAKRAKSLRSQWTCPANLRQGRNLRCDGGLPTKSQAQVDIAKAQLQELWGFLKSLTKLANYTEVRRDKADRLYKTHDGKAYMDHIANLYYGEDYGQLNDDQKDAVSREEGVQIQSGALDVALKRARAAGKAALQVEYAH